MNFSPNPFTLNAIKFNVPNEANTEDREINFLFRIINNTEIQKPSKDSFIESERLKTTTPFSTNND